jgi:phosphatidylglycerophosphatase A
MKQPVNTKERLVLVVGTAFGLGLAPVAPGSFAALLGLLIHALAFFFAPASLLVPILFASLILFTALHFWLNDTAARYWDDTDSGNFVLDEVAGYLVTALVVFPLHTCFATALHQLFFMGGAFLLFRVLDIIKLPPARQIDRQMHNAWGVILDDFVSGAYAGGIFWAAHALRAF